MSFVVVATVGRLCVTNRTCFVLSQCFSVTQCERLSSAPLLIRSYPPTSNIETTHSKSHHYHKSASTCSCREHRHIPHIMSSAENGAISQGEGKDPSSFLSDIIGNPVIVKLNSGVVYKGEMRP